MALNPSSFYAFQRGVSVIEFDKLGGVHLVSWFPCVVTFRIPFPFDQILELSSPAVTLVVNNALHFVFFFTID